MIVYVGWAKAAQVVPTRLIECDRVGTRPSAALPTLPNNLAADTIAWQYSSMKLTRRFAIAAAAWATFALACGVPARADDAFRQFLESVWPEAQKMGVSRTTFDAAMRGLEPDLTLPDLDGKPFHLSSLRGQKVLLYAWAPY